MPASLDARREPSSPRTRGLRRGICSLALAASLLLQPSCSPAPRSDPQPDVFVLLIDTLRSDRLGWYGGNRGVSPFLDSFARLGSVFWRAHAASSWTSPSVASLFTSRYPTQHGISSFSSVLDSSEVTLAEQLQQAGFATGGFTANLLVNQGLGYGQGFDKYEVYTGDPIKERADRLNRDVLRWLDRTRQARPTTPAFVYLQYMEPHEPFQPPADVLHRLAAQRGFDAARVARLEQLAAKAPPLEAFDKSEVPLAEDLYDAEVASLDESLRRFFQELEKRGRLNDALVIITADHGEEFLEHGAVGHGHTLYEEVIHVPLLIKLPRQAQRVDVNEVVSLVDLAPTVLDVAGLSPPPPFMGKSQLRLTQQSWLWRILLALLTPSLAHTAYSELGDFGATAVRPKVHQRSLVANGGEKLIELRPGGVEAYDLRRDAGEHDPVGLGQGTVESLSRAIADIGRDLTTVRPARTQALDEDTRERMRALGYDDHQH